VYPNAKTSCVVLYGDIRIPRWRTAAILNFDFWTIIWASIKIFDPNFVQLWKKSKAMRRSLIRFSKIQHGGHPPVQFTIDLKPFRQRQLAYSTASEVLAIYRLYFASSAARDRNTKCFVCMIGITVSYKSRDVMLRLYKIITSKATSGIQRLCMVTVL